MSIPINDISPRVQYTSGALQTVFVYPFPIFADTDLLVYKTLAGDIGIDLVDILTLAVDYTVTGVGAAGGGTVVLNVGAAVNDIITIVRDMPESRMNLYLNGGLFTATAVNDDFSRDVMMNQQNEMHETVLTPHYDNCAQVSQGLNIRDQLLPVLAPNTSWRMNAAGTFIEAFTIIPSGSGAVLPTTLNHIARFADAAGTVKDSSATISDAGELQTVSLVAEILLELQSNNGNVIQFFAPNALAATYGLTYPGALPTTANAPLVSAINGTMSFGNTHPVATTVLTLSAAQLLALNGVPVQVVGAPGANNIIVVHNMTFEYVFVATPYTVPGGSVITLLYGAAGPAAQATQAAAGLVDQGASTISVVNAQPAAPFTRAASVNQPIFITNTVGNLTVGDGTARIVITYSVMNV